MSKNNTPDRTPDRTRELDALLHRGVQADQRATKPPFAPTPPPTRSAAPQAPALPRKVAPRMQALDRITVRYTPDEALLLEKARGIAREMGYKVSDSAVFRLAIHALKPEQVTIEQIEAVLAADTRRRKQV